LVYYRLFRAINFAIIRSYSFILNFVWGRRYQLANNKTNILIVDDHTLFRKGIALYLEDEVDIDIIMEAPDGREALSFLKDNASEVDLIIMDLNMPGLSGEEATRIISEKWPEIKILILTSYGSGDKVYQMLNSGASGYLLKDAEPSELVIAIKAVVAGGSYFGQQLANELLTLVNKDSGIENTGETCSQFNQDLIEPLTDREIEVLKLLGQGLANSEIGNRLHISDNTVKTHVSNIFQKLNVKSRTQAAFLALEKGLI